MIAEFRSGRLDEDHLCRRGFEPWPFEPRDIDLVLLTHAHIDHSGLLMKVMRRVVRAVYRGDSPDDLSSPVNPDAVAELQARLEG